MRIGIVVGHTRISPGAKGVAPLAVYEYFFNSDLAEKMGMHAEALGHAHEVFFRDDGGIVAAYNRATMWRADVVVELHFNAANGQARGTQTLYGSKNPTSPHLAMYMQMALCKFFEREAHEDRGAKLLADGERGHLNVNLAYCPSVLVEPFFGDNADDAALAVNSKEHLASTIIEALVDWYKSGGPIHAA